MNLSKPGNWLVRLAKRSTVIVGCACSLLILSVWVLSYFRIPSLTFERVRSGRQTHYEARVILGCINLLSNRVGRFYYNPDTNLLGGFAFRLTDVGRLPSDWTFLRHLGLVLPLATKDVYRLPLWIPLLVSSIPLFIIWRRSRRPPKDHCRKCYYNLTGNTSGICPECGTPITREIVRPQRSPGGTR